MAQMAVVVFGLGAISLRSFVGGVFVVMPLFAVMLANFGLMGWLRTPLDISAMTTAAMAIGIGADYEIGGLLQLPAQRRDELIDGAAPPLGVARGSAGLRELLVTHEELGP
jgi:hypothetical protein